MKRILLIAALLLGISATAQLEINEPQETQEIWRNALQGQEIKEIINGQDTTFLFLYQNRRYTAIHAIELFAFSGSGELLAFLDACSQAIEEAKEFDVLIGIDNITIRKQSKRVIISTSSGWLYLDKKSINKIREALDAALNIKKPKR